MDTDALQRLDAFLSDPQVPQEDKTRAVAMARTQDQSAEPPPITPEGARERSGSYLFNKANQFVGALQGVGKDVENLVTGQPYGTGFPGQRGPLDTIGDVATTAAPIVAPELTAAGLAAGTLARGVGYSEPTADLLNAGTQLGVGGTQAVLGAGKAVREAPAVLKAAAQAKYGEAAAGAKGTITAADPFVQNLSDALESNLTHPAERAMATPLLNKATAPGSPGLSYADLDNALAGLRRVRGPSYVRGLIDDAAQSLVEGTPAGEARTAAKAAWSSLRSKPFRVGSLGASVTGGSLAARDISEGRYKRAALTLAATGLATAGLRGLTGRGMLAAAGGAAGPLAQTAVGVGSQIPNLAKTEDTGYTPDSGASIPLEPATTSPEQGSPPTPAPLTPLPGPYGREIAAVASLVKIPPQLIQSHMRVESGGNASAVGDGGASIGLMQIKPGTAATVAPQAGALLGRAPDLKNPLDNLVVGGLLLRHYLDMTHGDVTAAAQLYNGGEHTTGNAMTRDYAHKIVTDFAASGG